MIDQSIHKLSWPELAEQRVIEQGVSKVSFSSSQLTDLQALLT